MGAELALQKIIMDIVLPLASGRASDRTITKILTDFRNVEERHDTTATTTRIVVVVGLLF
jgi:hypothetical protein